jgi:hypothetical protein
MAALRSSLTSLQEPLAEVREEAAATSAKAHASKDNKPAALAIATIRAIPRNLGIASLLQ